MLLKGIVVFEQRTWYIYKRKKTKKKKEREKSKIR